MKVAPWLKSLFRIVKYTAAVLAAVGFILQASDWLTRPRDKLTAEIEYGPFLIPPSLNKEFENLEVLTDTDSLLARLKAPGPRGFTVDAADRVSSFLFRTLPTQLPPDIATLHGYWIAEVRNEGNTTLQDVAIILPETEYVSITPSGQEAISQKSGPVIPLGALRPKSSQKVVAWTSFTSPFRAKDIVLTHSNGTGGVRVMVPVGRFGQWFEGLWRVLTYIVWWLLVLVIYTIVGVIDMRRRRADLKQRQS